MVRGGTATDPADREGLAAFTADLLDEGSGGRSALQVADELARYGADLDVDVGPDATLLSLSTLTRYARQSLTLLAEMAIMPNLADPDIERVRKLRLERLRQMRDHAPAIAERAFARLLCRHAPLRSSQPGVRDLARRDQRRRLERLSPQHVRPCRDDSGDRGRRRCGRARGDGRHVVRGLGTSGRRRESQHRRGLRAAAAAAGTPAGGCRHGPARRNRSCASATCAPRARRPTTTLVVLNTILGGQFVSRVNLNLREEEGLCLRRAHRDSIFVSASGPFVLQTSVQSDKTVPAIRESLREIGDIGGARPATAAELATAVASITLGYPRGFETAQHVARGVAQLGLHDLPDTYFEEFVPKVEAVSLDEVSRVAVQCLDVSRHGHADRGRCGSHRAPSCRRSARLLF